MSTDDDVFKYSTHTKTSMHHNIIVMQVLDKVFNVTFTVLNYIPSPDY